MLKMLKSIPLRPKDYFQELNATCRNVNRIYGLGRMCVKILKVEGIELSRQIILCVGKCTFCGIFFEANNIINLEL